MGIGWAVAVLVTLTRFGNPVDAWCYYGADPAQPYRLDGCFMYSPPVAVRVMDGIRSVMSFEAFTFLLRSAELLVLIVVTGPAIGLALFIPAVAIELNAANINLLIVAAVLVGFRHPWAWAFVVLTKVTPGVGMLWFAVRREWRHFAIALGATMAIAVASWLARARSVARLPRRARWLAGRQHLADLVAPAARCARGRLGRPERPPLGVDRRRLPRDATLVFPVAGHPRRALPAGQAAAAAAAAHVRRGSRRCRAVARLGRARSARLRPGAIELGRRFSGSIAPRP